VIAGIGQVERALGKLRSGGISQSRCRRSYSVGRAVWLTETKVRRLVVLVGNLIPDEDTIVSLIHHREATVFHCDSVRNVESRSRDRSPSIGLVALHVGLTEHHVWGCSTIARKAVPDEHAVIGSITDKQTWTIAGGVSWLSKLERTFGRQSVHGVADGVWLS
jgi:hypothetical protein